MTAPIIRPEPSPEQEPKLPDQIADAWAAVLIDIYQRLKPLNAGLDEPDVVPPKTGWTNVPGLSGVKWRRSQETFDQGTSGSLFYDVRIRCAS